MIAFRVSPEFGERNSLCALRRPRNSRPPLRRNAPTTNSEFIDVNDLPKQVPPARRRAASANGAYPWAPFHRRSETHNVSDGGCKFYLRIEIAQDTVLPIVNGRNERGHDSAPVLVQVVRVERTSSFRNRPQLPPDVAEYDALCSNDAGNVTDESIRTNIPVCAGSSTSLPFFVMM